MSYAADRVAAAAKLANAQAMYRGAQVDLGEAEKMISKLEAAEDRDPGALAFWYGRRCELLRIALEHAGSVEAIYMGLYIPNDVPSPA
jgi:hypothetical protein